MVKLQRILASIVTTSLTFTAFILNSHRSYFLSTSVDGVNEVLSTIFVGALVFSHFAPFPCHASKTNDIRFAREQPLALPTELQGNNYF